jgi:hypothetical protein
MNIDGERDWISKTLVDSLKMQWGRPKENKKAECVMLNCFFFSQGVSMHAQTFWIKRNCAWSIWKNFMNLSDFVCHVQNKSSFSLLWLLSMQELMVILLYENLQICSLGICKLL